MRDPRHDESGPAQDRFASTLMNIPVPPKHSAPRVTGRQIRQACILNLARRGLWSDAHRLAGGWAA